MKRLLATLGLAVAVVLLLLQPCFGQQLSEVLADETDLVLSIPKPVAIAGKIAKSLELDDSSWDPVWKVLADEKFGVFDSDDLQAMQELCLSNIDLLGEIEELNVICFSLDFNDICVVCSLDHTKHAELEGFFDSVKKLLDRESPEDVDEEGEGNGGSSIQLQELTVEFWKGWVVASTSDQRTARVLAKLKNSISGEEDNTNKKPHGISRRISRVSSVFDEAVDRDSSVMIFGNPVAFGSLFFPSLSPEEREAFQFDEVPAMGLRISFPGSRDFGRPSVGLDFVVPFTEPRTGFGKMVTCFKPLGEIPSIPFELTKMEAMAFDPQELFETSREIYDEANGPGSYLESKQALMDQYSLDYLQDELPRTDEEWTFNFSLGNLHRVKMQRNADFGAASRYLDATLGFAQELTLANGDGHIYKKHECEFGIIYPSRGGIVRGKYSDAETELKAYAKKNGTSFINPQWTITSSCTPAVMRLLDSLYSKEEPSESINVIRAARAKLSGKGENVYRIQFFEMGVSPLAYGEYNRVIEKFGNKSIEFSEYWRRKPNDDGYKMVIESQTDSLAVASTLMSVQLAKRLGSAIFFYSSEDNHLRVSGGLYPDLKFGFDYNLAETGNGDNNDND